MRLWEPLEVLNLSNVGGAAGASHSRRGPREETTWRLSLHQEWIIHACSRELDGRRNRFSPLNRFLLP